MEDLIMKENQNKKILEFLRSNSILINNNDWSGLMYNAWTNYFYERDFIKTIVEIICDILDEDEKLNLKLESICRDIKEICDYYLYSTFNTPSNDWSRFTFIIYGVETFNVDRDAIIAYLKSNHSRYLLKFDQIDGKYSYDGSFVDYDLGWFNKREYEKEYFEETGEYL